MKRHGSTESLGAYMSICPTQTEEQSPRNGHVYGREFQSMLEGLDEEGCVEESGHVGGGGGGGEKKRRLSVDQVKALEKNFEIENKLEPERKVRLATELGLQPRQVAVWFQNRRARWKTKQLERDYGTLKARYESLEVSYEDLKDEKNELLKKVEELKSKLKGGGGGNEIEQNQIPVKGEGLVGSDPNDKVTEMSDTAAAGPDKALKFSVAADLKDGSSDSDSSAILQEERSPIAAANSSSPTDCGGGLQHQFLVSAAPGSSSSTAAAVMGWYHQLHPPKAMYQSQFVKEEHNFFGAEETCDIFSDEQPPTLQQWYSSEEQWN